MSLPLAIVLGLAAAPASGCAPVDIGKAISTTLAARQAGDLPAAKRAIDPFAACPVTDHTSYAAHVLRADIAVSEGDWATASTALAGLEFHPESGLGAHAAFLKLRVDQGLGDGAAFTADRAGILAANEARLLAAGGHKRESFAVPGGTVAAYDAKVQQGGFARVFEFIITPDDPAAYPVTLQLTDDQATALIEQQLTKSGKGAKRSHVWFLDLYTCSGHSTLAPPKEPVGDQPDYAEIRSRVVATFAEGKLLAAAPPPEKSPCMTARWIVPGFGIPSGGH